VDIVSRILIPGFRITLLALRGEVEKSTNGIGAAHDANLLYIRRISSCGLKLT